MRGGRGGRAAGLGEEEERAPGRWAAEEGSPGAPDWKTGGRGVAETPGKVWGPGLPRPPGVGAQWAQSRGWQEGWEGPA